MGKVPTTCRHQALEEQLAPRRSRQGHAPMDRRDAYRFHKGVSRHRRFSNAACCDTAALMAGACTQSARASSASVATANLGCPSALRPTLIGMKVHLFCALSPRLGGIMGARHRPYGQGILAVGPGLIANWFLVFLVIISMPIGVVANAHRHQGTYFLRIIAKALWALGIGRTCRGILAVGPSLIDIASHRQPRCPSA